MPAERKETRRTGSRNEPSRWEFRGLIAYAVLSLFLLWVWQDLFGQLAYRTIPYSEFKQRLEAGEVREVSIGSDEVRGRVEPVAPSGQAEGGATTEPWLFRSIRVEDPSLVGDLARAGVRFSGERPGLLHEMIWTWLVPLGLMAGLWIWLGRRIAGAGTTALTFGRTRARITADRDTGVTFADVAGCEEAKAELREVVDFLQRPERYRNLGARVPRGVLLLGPPGTGKTLLARAVAGEARVPFFSLSGSEFVEMFVGVGAARVRDLFEQAKRHAPCIVFIDELDAIGRQRGVHLNVGNDEREQTLNQLLAELDGFEPNSGVILLGATNRPEVMDRALLRPGRFDRQVLLDAPDLAGREAVLRVHARGKPLAADVDLTAIARSTPGFAGADLANVLNEAAILAARAGSGRIEQRHLEEAVEKVVAGPERRSRRLDEADRRRVAYHEVGHALVATLGGSDEPVSKISIVPRGRAALGYTLQLPTADRYLASRSALLARIRGLLGGRAAEELALGEASTGASNDLERATALAREMVALHGMGKSAGLMRCARRAGPAFLAPEPVLERDCSDETARAIDLEVKELLEGAYAEARDLLVRQRPALERIAEELLRCETLEGERFRELLASAPGA